MNNTFWIFLTYLIVGVVFLFLIRKKLSNKIYRDLTLYYYEYSEGLKSFYVLYVRCCVFIFWPVFLVALLSDLIIEFWNRKMSNNLEMNFAATATPMKITNSNGDTIILSVDPVTQHFNITTHKGNPIINVGGNNDDTPKVNKYRFGCYNLD